MRSRFFARPYLALTLLVILLCAAWLRFRQLDAIPPGFHFDESFEGLEAWRILTRSDYRPVFLRGNFGVPVGFAYLTAGMFGLFNLFGGEAGPLAMRSVAAVIGILTIPALMGAGRELVLLGLLGHDAAKHAALPVALASGAALAGLRWHVHFSRMGIEPILGPLLWAFAIWTLLWAWRIAPERPRMAYAGFIMCGLALAGAMYSYQAVWILPFIVAACAVILLLMPASQTEAPLIESSAEDRAPSRLQSPRFKGLVAAGFVATLLILPLAALFAQEPELMTTRPTQVIAGEGNQQTLWESTVATAGMFAPFGSGDMDPRRNLPGEPALNWIWGIAFFIGVAVGLRNIRRPAWLIVWLGWLGLLMPGVVTEYAPHFHRILAASAPTAVLVGVGLWYMGLGIQRSLGFLVNHPLSRRWAATAVVPLLVGGAGWDANDYFNRWAPRDDLYYAFDQGLWEIGRWSAVQPHAQVFISPRGPEHPSLAFAWRNLTTDAVTVDATDNVTTFERDSGDTGLYPIAYDGRHALPAHAGPAARESIYIVIEHEDFRSPLLLPDVFSAADLMLEKEFTDRAGGTYALAYRRAAQTVPQREPAFSVPAQLTHAIRLTGYDLLPESPRSGEIAYIQLYWQTDASPEGNLTVFLHLVDPATGDIIAGHDAPPGQGTLPTHTWQDGWLVLDEHQIALPHDLPPGEYQLRTGLYPTGLPHEPVGPPVELGVVVIQEPS